MTVILNGEQWIKIIMGGESGSGIPITFSDTFSTDPFGRLRVGNPFAIIDTKLLLDKQPVFWDEQITNNSGNASSTHSSTNAAVLMHVENGDSIIRQTKQSALYQPGKGQLVFQTGVLGGAVANSISELGLYNSQNGILIRRDGSDYSFIIKKSGVETPYPRSVWLDPMDGTGTSGINMDFSKANIYMLDMEWLGVGRVRFGAVVDGKLYKIHEANHANNVSSVYMSVPNLPLRYAISSTGGTAEMSHICGTVISEGGQDRSGINRSDYNGITAAQQVTAATAGSLYAVCGIRLKSTHGMASVRPSKLSMLVPSAGSGVWVVCYEPTLTTGLTWSNEPESAVQFGRGLVAGDVITNPGYILDSGFISQRVDAIATVSDFFRLGQYINGTSDQVVLGFAPAGNNEKVVGSLGWNEVI